MKHLQISDKAHVVALDDKAENLHALMSLLSEDYHVHPFVSPKGLFQYLEEGKPADLILLDIMMPEMDGYEVCARLRAQHEMDDIPIIFLTGLSNREDEEKGLKAGAADYITKPFSAGIVRSRVRIHTTLSRAMRIVQGHNELLDVRMAERTSDLARKNAELMLRADEIVRTQEATMLALSSLAETRDSDTGSHIFRTQAFVRALAVELRRKGLFRESLTEEMVDRLYRSAALHDIGKVAIPDHILLKPGKLSAEEFEIMKTHAALGGHAIESAEAVLASPESFLKVARDIAHHHHERWDGNGYPDGLAGKGIPLPARIMAVADVYDALTCERVYKPGMPHEKATAILRDGRGTHFDPEVLDAFLDIQNDFAAIARDFSDEGGGGPGAAPA